MYFNNLYVNKLCLIKTSIDEKNRIQYTYGYILLILIYVFVVGMIIAKDTEVKGEILSILHFMANDVYAIILGVLFIYPVPLLILSCIRKRKDLIKGLSVATLISILLTITIAIS